MKMEQLLKEKLTTGLLPNFIELINESAQHNVPKNSETHFKLRIVSEMFNGLSRVQRQRLIYSLVAEELKNGVHALTMEVLTPQEWDNRKDKPTISPPCLGGSKGHGGHE